MTDAEKDRAKAEKDRGIMGSKKKIEKTYRTTCDKLDTTRNTKEAEMVKARDKEIKEEDTRYKAVRDSTIRADAHDQEEQLPRYQR